MQALVHRVVYSVTGTGVDSGVSSSIELVAAMPCKATGIEVYTDVSQVLLVTKGPSATAIAMEKELAVIPPRTGTRFIVPCLIAEGERISARSLTVSATAGQIVLSFYR